MGLGWDIKNEMVNNYSIVLLRGMERSYTEAPFLHVPSSSWLTGSENRMAFVVSNMEAINWSGSRTSKTKYKKSELCQFQRHLRSLHWIETSSCSPSLDGPPCSLSLLLSLLPTYPSHFLPPLHYILISYKLLVLGT